MRRKPPTVAFWQGRLPHWKVEDGRYFVTIHLAGAIPVVGRRRIRALAAQYRRVRNRTSHRALELHRRIFAEMESWLDRSEAAVHLAHVEVAQIVQRSIEHRIDNGIWSVFEHVIMPSHIHLFFELVQPGLKDVLEAFKRRTGHEAGKKLQLAGNRFWQREWFDHWSRSDAEDDRIAAYIRQNPVKAGLVDDYRAWPWGSWRRE